MIHHNHQDIHSGSGEIFRALVGIKTAGFRRRALALQLNGGWQSGTTGSSLIKPLVAIGEPIASVNSGRSAAISEVRRLSTNQQRRATGPAGEPVPQRGRQPRAPASRICQRRLVGGNDPLLLGHHIGYLLSGYLPRALISATARFAHWPTAATPGSTRDRSLSASA